MLVRLTPGGQIVDESSDHFLELVSGDSCADRALETRWAVSHTKGHAQPREECLRSANARAIPGGKLNKLLPEAVQAIQDAINCKLGNQVEHVLLVRKRVAVPSGAQV